MGPEVIACSTATAQFLKRREACKGHVARGDFFWFVFFFTKENEQKRPNFPNIFSVLNGEAKPLFFSPDG
jgi:hypothetical protein